LKIGATTDSPISNHVRENICRIDFAETFSESLHRSIVKKYLKWIIAGLVAVFLLIQLPNLGRTSPHAVPGHDVLSSNAPPPEIVSILKDACYDCHSYDTRLPWYGYVAPVSWWLDSHINDGRDRLNFSKWPNDDPESAARKWNHVSNAVRDGDMPLPSYTWIHRAARLSDEQRKKLADWAEQESQRLKTASNTNQ